MKYNWVINYYNDVKQLLEGRGNLTKMLDDNNVEIRTLTHNGVTTNYNIITINKKITRRAGNPEVYKVFILEYEGKNRDFYKLLKIEKK